ncbi:MAG: YceI family protein [Balneolaceae bacterium]
MFIRHLLKTTFILLLTLITGLAAAQDISLKLLPDSEISIEGTSNVRDWDADVTTIHAELILNGFEESDGIQNLSPAHFKTLTLRMPVKGIDAGGRSLTNNIQKYLKKDDYPDITFKLNKISEVQVNDSEVILTADGVINAAGKDHSVTLKVNGSTDNQGTLVFSGTQELKMTDFDIEPPTAIFGTVRAVDEFSVHFSVKFQN